MTGAARLAGGFLAFAFLVGSPVQAATFGHARLISATGAPLTIVVPVSGLASADLQTFSARPAPAADWAAAGLTPPVALDHLTVSVVPSPRSKSDRMLRIHSSQPFVGSLADLLLDVQTASGQQRYQVSLLVPGPVSAVTASTAGAAATTTHRLAPAVGAATATSSRRIPSGSISVRRGDSMFAVARRHAVDQVSVYQLMLALQRANPQAFIHDNINLLRADAVLAVPSIDDMLSISDAEARRQFVAQTAAFNRLRSGLATAAVPLAGQAGIGDVSAVSPQPAPADKSSASDRLQLSQANQSAVDTQAAQDHALKDAESRVGQLQDNVQNLNTALQAQGEAARDAVANGAQAVTKSIGEVANAISEASHEAAAQANAQLNTANAQPSSGSSADAEAGATPDGAAALSGNAALPSGSAAQSATAVAQPDGSALSGATPDGGQANASSQAQAAGDISPSTSSSEGASGLGQASSLTSASAAIQAAEISPSPKTQHRVSWIQDHLLAIMTGLLAVIVFLIAWLLRRANTTRDETDAEQVVTDAMVREKLQGVDLDLPPHDGYDSTPRP